MSRLGAEEIPPVPRDVEKYGELSIRFCARRRYEGNTGVNHPMIGCLEIFNSQEQSYAPRKLIPYGYALMVAIGARQENSRLPATRPDHDPPFRPAIIRRRRNVFEQFEIENANEEINRRIVILDDHRYEVEIRHYCATSG
jgi:hypothetical protein